MIVIQTQIRGTIKTALNVDNGFLIDTILKVVAIPAENSYRRQHCVFFILMEHFLLASK